MRSLRATLVGAVLVAAIQQRSEAQPSNVGAWTQPFSLPLVSMHASMLPTGKVLLYSADHGVHGVEAWLLNPTTLDLQDVAPPWYPACSGQSFLADGRLLVTGGQINSNPPTGTVECHIFDPFTEQWSRIEDMLQGRWYATDVTLGDGRVVTFSGLDEYGNFNPNIEIWTPGATNNWQVIGQKYLETYPWMHLLTSGLVFRSGPDGRTETYDVSNDVWTVIGYRNVAGRFDATSVLLPPTPNRVLVMGGNDQTNEPTDTAEMIDLNSSNPQWTLVPPMDFPRMDFNAAILPNGKVFVVGGRSNFDPTANYVYTPEIYDPQTSTWTMVAPHQRPRWYHSTALLLPDARVLAAGGEDEPTGEIYSPPYLFQGTRPVIQSAPAIIQYGQSFTLSFSSSTDGNRIVLIRNSCATHSVNFDQRYVSLADVTGGSGTFAVPGPTTANLAPPGYYMLYVVDGNGVPSISAQVHVLPEALKILEADSTGNGSVQLFWSLNFADATVLTSGSLGPSATWSPQSGTPTIQNGRYTLTVPATSNPTFFRLSSQ